MLYDVIHEHTPSPMKHWRYKSDDLQGSCLLTMNSLFRPVLRSVAYRHVPLIVRSRPMPIARPAFMGITAALLQARHVASSVTNRPGSQSFEHAATNVKEELGNSATDLAKAIAGANVTRDSISDSSGNSFVSIELCQQRR